jgi:hypothetical protein
MGSGKSTAAAAKAVDDADHGYEQAALEAFNSSACVKLALQMPNVDMRLIVSMYKAGFSDGCMYGVREARDSFDRALLVFAAGEKH